MVDTTTNATQNVITLNNKLPDLVTVPITRRGENEKIATTIRFMILTRLNIYRSPMVRIYAELPINYIYFII